MSDTSNEVSENKGGKVPNGGIIVGDFADLRGLSKVDRLALKNKYKLERKTKNDWIRELSGKVDLRKKK